MTKETAQKQLARAEAIMERVADYVEGAGLSGLSNKLDGAADHIEDVRETLSAL